MDLIVNLDEFSELCGVTAETMRVHIRGIEGHPTWLVERGDRGRGYKIEAEGGLAWWKAKRDDEEQASAERQAQLHQLRLDLLGDAADEPDGLGLSGKQRREEYAAVMERIKLRRTMGELVEVAALDGPGANAVVELRRKLQLVAPEFAAKVDLSIEDRNTLAAMIERAVSSFLESMPTPLRGRSDA